MPGSSRTSRALRHAKLVLATAVLTTGAVAGSFDLGATPTASAAASVTPSVECVTSDSSTGTYTAYFGYDNTGSLPVFIALGDSNLVSPGDPFQGQPETFNVGNYPQVFSSTWDPSVVSGVTWFFNGDTATATASSPTCTSGVTSPASDLAAGSATLNGVVTPGGQVVSYDFEYGSTPSLGQSTPVEQASGTIPELVQAPLTDLVPSTTYYFRLDTTDPTFGTADNQVLSFMTPSQIPTTTQVTSSVDPSYVRQPVTFTASVGPTDGGGSVAFYVDGSLTPIAGCGSQPLNGQDQATCTTSALEVGTHTVAATYSGDTEYQGSTGSLPQSQQVTGCPGGQTSRLMTAATNVGTIFGLFCVNPKTGAGSYQQEAVSGKGPASGSGTVVVFGSSSVIGAVGQNLVLGGSSIGSGKRVGNVFVEALPLAAKGVYTLG